MASVLFLCTGNYYRSRFAEHWFEACARRKGLDWTAFSRGLALELGAGNDGAISQYTLEALESRGVPTAATIRAPISVTRADLERATLIIALHEVEHRPLLAERFPEFVERVEYWHVPDVYDLAADRALRALGNAIEWLVDRLQRATPSPDVEATLGLRSSQSSSAD
jgi:protein-tyrosine phosphatase